MATFPIDPSQIVITPQMIARLIGSDPEDIPEPYNEIIQNELNKIPDYTDIIGGYRIISEIQLTEENHSLQAEGVLFNVGNQVYKYLHNAGKAAFFVCTAGAKVSNRSKKLMTEGFMLEGYICDVVGSTIVEKAMDIIQQKLTTEMNEEGLNTTNRYSPGYCEWNVQEQHKLFSLFPENFCGIKLSETAVMEPVKSISGAIGIGEEVSYNAYVCHACTSVNCLYRNVRHAL